MKEIGGKMKYKTGKRLKDETYKGYKINFVRDSFGKVFVSINNIKIMALTSKDKETAFEKAKKKIDKISKIPVTRSKDNLVQYVLALEHQLISCDNSKKRWIKINRKYFNVDDRIKRG